MRTTQEQSYCQNRSAAKHISGRRPIQREESSDHELGVLVIDK